jgi:hypothetical protein
MWAKSNSSLLIADIIHGWQLWRFERLRWWFLVVSFGLFCGLTVVVVQLANRLSQDRPDWAESKQTLYTLSYHLQDEMIVSKGNHLELAATLPGVQQFSKFVITKKQVVINGQSVQAQLLFYDEALLRMLEAQPSLLPSGSGIYFSAAFAESRTGTKHYILLGNTAVPVQRFSSAAFDRFAGKSIDIYLPATHLAHWFGMGLTNSTELKTLLNALPLYHAIMQVQPVFDADQGLLQLQRLIEQAPNDIVSINLRPQVKLVSGVELFPRQKAEISRQLWLLMLMLVALAVMLLSNYAAVMANQAVMRSSEFSLQHAVGARLIQQIQQLLAENTLFMLCIFLLSGLFAYLAQSLFYQSVIFQQYFGAQMAFSWGLWALTLVGCFALIILTTLLPMLNVLKQQRLQRSITGVTRMQRQLLRMQFILQVALTMFALSLCFSVSYQEWQKRQIAGMDSHIYGYQLERDDSQPFVLPEQFVRGGQLQITLSDTALIRRHAPFTAVKLTDDHLLRQIYTDQLTVSDNFFTALSATMLIPAQPGSQQVVINQSLARLLRPDGSLQQLIGKSIELSEEPELGAMQIRGIVADLPHAGVGFESMPMLYRSLQDQRTLDGPIYLYSQIKLQPEAVTAMLDLQLSALKVTALGDIPAQLLALDGAGSGLFMLTVQISVLIVLLTALGMLNQMKMQLMNDRQLFGLQLAIGQRTSQLIVQQCRQHLLLSTVSAVSCVIALWLLQPQFSSLGLHVTGVVPLAGAILLVAISVFLVVWLAVYSFGKQSLRLLLTQ